MNIISKLIILTLSICVFFPAYAQTDSPAKNQGSRWKWSEEREDDAQLRNSIKNKVKEANPNASDEKINQEVEKIMQQKRSEKK